MRIRIQNTASKSKSYQSEVIVRHLCRNSPGNSVEVKFEGRINHLFTFVFPYLMLKTMDQISIKTPNPICRLFLELNMQ
jgi:hypothetical protein